MIDSSSYVSELIATLIISLIGGFIMGFLSCLMLVSEHKYKQGGLDWRDGNFKYELTDTIVKWERVR